MADRFWGAASSAGVSELVRLVDGQSGDAYGNFCATWNPIANAGRAVTHAVVEGDVSRLREGVPLNPFQMAASATNVAAATTRRIPGVRNATEGINAVVSGVGTWGNAVTGSLVNNIIPAQRGAPNLDGYAYACAKVADIVYKPYADRPSSFTDKEGDTWTELQFGVGHSKAPEPANRSHISVYSHGGVVIVGFRGSAEGVDWYSSNVHIAIGAIPPQRCAEAENFVRALIQRGEFRTCCLTGHSLGGTIATYVGHKVGIKVHAFNAGAGPGDGIAKTIMEYAGNPSSDSVVLHRIRNDVVSAFSARLDGILEVKVYNQTRRGLAHGMHQFLG